MIIADDFKSFEETLLRLSKYKSFAEIPERMKTKEVAADWLKVMKTAGTARFVDYFGQIPKAFVSQDLLKYVVDSDVRLLANINPEDSSNYAELCAVGFQRSYLAANYFHESFRTTQTVASLVAFTFEFNKVFAEIPWVMNVITPDQIETVSLANISCMVSLPDEKISDVALSKHLSRGENFLFLRAKGKLHLGAKHLKTGAWPEPQHQDAVRPSKPRTLSSAFKYAVSGSYPKDLKALYMANLMTYPIEDVMPLMQTRQHVSLAMEMYSAKELKPFIKTNRHLKVALLEDSLGL
jgi:hypothetical protein